MIANMKTRLLKRLRKEAKILYKIKRISGEYCVYARKKQMFFSFIYMIGIVHHTNA